MRMNLNAFQQAVQKLSGVMHNSLNTVAKLDNLSGFATFTAISKTNNLVILRTSCDAAVGADPLYLDIKIVDKVVKSLTEDVVLSCEDGVVRLTSGDVNMIVYSERAHGVINEGSYAHPLTTDKLLELPASELVDNLKKVSPLCAKDELRAVMCGVCFDLSPMDSVLVASDGITLGKTSIGTEFEVAANFIIAKEDCDILIKVLAKTDGHLSVHRASDNADRYIFMSGDLIYVVKATMGQYVNYNSVIPANAPHQFKLNAKELLDALEVLKPFAKGTRKHGRPHAGFRIEFGDVLTLSDFNKACEVTVASELEADSSHPKWSLYLDSAILKKLIKALQADMSAKQKKELILKLELFRSDMPCVIKKEGYTDELYLIMPIMPPEK